ncbi:transposase [Fusarium mundagurra]|uniref:Transposase n=1 Tax=Fusarium mundagurra TaxID=1567541 RepID=A0A8H5XNQ8_9HYPO|nr:transposase [Fusarium mundagurra]
MGSSAPHHRHQSSLEGFIDFSTGASPSFNPDELDKGAGVLRRVIEHFEPLSTEKPYNRPRLVRLTAVDITIDGVIDLDDEMVEEEIRLALNAFADFLVDNFFLPLKAAGSKTPQPSPAASSRITSTRPVVGSVERVASLRRDCLVRDRHRCVISRDFDMKEAERRIEESGYDYASDDQGQLLKEQEPGSFAELEVAHILPHSLMTTTGNPELNKSKETALAILDMFDHDIVHLIEGPDIDRSRNALTLKIDLHRQFGNFKVFFEPTNQPHSYRIDSTLRQPFRNPIFPVNRTFFLTPERTIDPPSARLLAVHNAICQILHLSAAGNYIDSILRDLDDGAYNSFFSLLRSRDPARDWSIRKYVRDELRSQDCPVLLPEAVRIIKDNSFWLKLEAAIAVLKPVNEFQHASEADGAGIAHVVNRWLQIKSKWSEMGEADQFPDIPWDDIEAISKARLDKQTYDIHWIADALRPDKTGPNSKLPPSVFARVQEYLQKQLKNDDEYHRALSEFTHFRMRTGGPDCLFNKHSAGSILARVAVKVMNTLANSVPSERSFSAISFIHTKARNRLTPMHADMQAFIFMNDRVLDRLKDQKYAHKKRWADLEEKDWLELEDSYLELFVNAQGKRVWMDGVMASASGDFEWEGVLQSTGDILGVGTEVKSEV